MIRLENGIEAILVSDPETDKAGAALDVHVGHFSDPDALPGLAHFLEHMLFMGNKRFPGENEYSEFLSKHGGRSNAFTATENTNYYFDVLPDKLEAVLDIFSGFFTSPLFAEGSTQREMKAVHSENSQNLLNDMWRQFQLLKSTSNPEHPFSKFGTGNLETLRDGPAKAGIKTREELLKFHALYYSANIMKLCILGKQSLDDLQCMAKKYFSAVENKARAVPSWTSQPFTPKFVSQLYEVVPVKDLRQLQVVWPVPPCRQYYKEKPASLMSHLIGHEGVGSILSLLKARGWANGLSAGLDQECTGFASFGVSIDLTPKGLENYENIVVIIYEYIELMKAASDSTWKTVFEECRDVAAMNFRFKGKESPFRYCSNLAQRLQKYKPGDVLEGPWRYARLDLDVLRSKFLSSLVPQRMRVHLVSKTFEGKTELKEKWYETAYNCRALDAKFVAACCKPSSSGKLALPKPNEFIATNFDLVIGSEEAKKKSQGDAKAGTATPTYPARVIDEPGLRAWHKTDDVFFKPKGSVYASLAAPHLVQSPRSYVLLELFVLAAEDSLVEFSYDATLASLSHSISMSKKGMVVKVAGYTHKLPLLLYRVVERVKALRVDPGNFSRLRELLARKYANFARNQPYVHALYHQGRALASKRFDVQDKMAVLQGVSVQDLQAFADGVLDRCDIEVLVHGNYTRDTGVKIARKIKELVNAQPLRASQRATIRAVRLADGTTYRIQRRNFNPADVNSSVCALYQIGTDSHANSAQLKLITQLIREPAFDQLRTKEQLGYSVFSVASNVDGALCLLVIVQSPTRGAQYLDDRIEAFMRQFEFWKLGDMSDEVFEANAASLVKKLREKDKTMRQESARHWAEILYRNYTFDRVEKEIAEVDKLTLETTRDFFRKYVAISASRAKLSTQVFGKDRKIGIAEKDESKSVIEKDGSKSAADESKSGAEAKAKQDAGAKESESKPAKLPPVPRDTVTKKIDIQDPDAFQRSMPLFPCFLK